MVEIKKRQQSVDDRAIGESNRANIRIIDDIPDDDEQM